MSTEDPDISVESESQIKAMREQQKLQFQAQLPILLQDPTTPEISKNFAKRYSMKLMGIGRDQINILVPPTYEEFEAKDKVMMINNNDPLGAKVDEIDVDHYTFLYYFDTALDTEVKYQAIRNRKDAIIATGQNLKKQPQP